jgi:hypothetical protein
MNDRILRPETSGAGSEQLRTMTTWEMRYKAAIAFFGDLSAIATVVKARG